MERGRRVLNLLLMPMILSGLTHVTLALTLNSHAFYSGGTIPDAYTCYGRGLIPPLNWQQVPTDAQTLALIVDDLDAPRGHFTHLVLFNMPATWKRLPKNSDAVSKMRWGRNSAGKLNYFPLCPPAGSGLHRYYFRLYALNSRLVLSRDASRQTLLGAIMGHQLAEAVLMGTVKSAE